MNIYKIIFINLTKFTIKIGLLIILIYSKNVYVEDFFKRAQMGYFRPRGYSGFFDEIFQFFYLCVSIVKNCENHEYKRIF